MDFLNNTAAQVRELFLSMTPGARIVAGLLIAVVAVSIGYLFQQTSAGPDEYLFGGEYLAASDLNKIEAAIASRRLSGHTREGNRIRVPAGQKADYMAAVAEAGALPGNFRDILEKALDKGGPWESRDMARKRLQIAKADMLSETIRAMPWIENAVVFFDEQEGMGLHAKKQVVGSVNVMPIAGETVTTDRKRKLQKLVSHSVLGLSPDQVAVTSLGDDTSFAGGGISPDDFENEYLRARAIFNERTRQDILAVVNYIPNVRVQVNAELDSVASKQTTDVQANKDPLTSSEQQSSDSTNQSSSDASGRPGLDAQGPIRDQQGLAGESTTNSSKSSDRSESSIAGHKTLITHEKGYVPKTVYATLAVPRDHLVTVWQMRNPAAPGSPPREPEQADLKSIEEEIRGDLENMVERLLPGHVLGEDAFKYVTVEFFDLPAREPIPESSFATTAMAWTGRNWGRLSMFMLAAFSLLVLRSMASAPPTPSPSSIPGLTLDLSEEDEAGAEGGEDGESRQRLRLKKGASLKDDLVDIVRDDPDAAAAILRSWIGKAA